MVASGVKTGVLRLPLGFGTDLVKASCRNPLHSCPVRIVGFFSLWLLGAHTPALTVHRPYSKMFQLQAGPGRIEVCQVWAEAEGQ